jgi:hypothetical protein
VTAPRRNPFALDSSGNPRPSVAGVFDNVIRGNWITDNGLQGEGQNLIAALHDNRFHDVSIPVFTNP